MATLADSVKVRSRFARSANIERDIDQRDPLSGYVVTARVLDVVERIATAAKSNRGGGVVANWSVRIRQVLPRPST